MGWAKNLQLVATRILLSQNISNNYRHLQIDLVSLFRTVLRGETFMERHKNQVGSFVVAGHFIILLSIIIAWVKHGFLFEEMVTALGLIGPLFAGYTTVIFSHIIEHAQDPKAQTNEDLSFVYRAASFLVPAVFIAVVGASVYMWANKIGFTEFEQFKILVGLLEGAFGVYVGQFIYSMFKKPEKEVRLPRPLPG